MQKIRIFLKLSLKLKILLFIAYIFLGYIRVVLLIVPFHYIAKIWLKPIYFKKPMNPITPQLISRAQTIGKAVAVAAKYTPWQSKCLAQSIVCKIILRHLHIPHTLYIGVAKDQGIFRAHAWVSYNNLIINGGSNSFDTYKIMTQFSDNYI